MTNEHQTRMSELLKSTINFVKNWEPKNGKVVIKYTHAQKELKDMCKELGFPVTGNKTQLESRLITKICTKGPWDKTSNKEHTIQSLKYYYGKEPIDNKEFPVFESWLSKDSSRSFLDICFKNEEF